MSRPRRLHILELRSVWGTGGGPEKTILHGAALANRDDVAVTVSYIRDQRDDVFALHRRAADLNIDYQEITERHSFDVGVWQQLLHLLRERRIDIVHSHDYKTDLLAWLLMRRTGVAAMSTVHGWIGYTWRERFVYYPVGKRLLARFPAVVAVSTKIKSELVRCGVPSDRVEVILNSIDTSVFRSAPELRQPARRQLAVDDDDFVIGAVGRLEREKRFDLLIHMFKQVVAEHRRARLVIVGDGSLRAELTALTQSLGVLEACRWLGHRHDIVELYQAFDVLVQSSETEGTPNAILEAMATETPIVATDVGGTSELARPGIDGLVVPNHDVAALKAAVDSVRLDPGGARARSISARQRAEAELSFVARTHRLERLYRRLASEYGILVKEPAPTGRLGQAS